MAVTPVLDSILDLDEPLRDLVDTYTSLLRYSHAYSFDDKFHRNVYAKCGAPRPSRTTGETPEVSGHRKGTEVNTIYHHLTQRQKNPGRVQMAPLSGTVKSKYMDAVGNQPLDIPTFVDNQLPEAGQLITRLQAIVVDSVNATRNRVGDEDDCHNAMLPFMSVFKVFALWHVLSKRIKDPSPKWSLLNPCIEFIRGKKAANVFPDDSVNLVTELLTKIVTLPFAEPIQPYYLFCGGEAKSTLTFGPLHVAVWILFITEAFVASGLCPCEGDACPFAEEKREEIQKLSIAERAKHIRRKCTQPRPVDKHKTRFDKKAVFSKWTKAYEAYDLENAVKRARRFTDDLRPLVDEEHGVDWARLTDGYLRHLVMCAARDLIQVR